MQQHQVKRRMDIVLEHVKKILGNAKQPVHLSSVQHTYSDKYTVVEHAANGAICAATAIFAHLGLTPENLVELINTAKTSRITLQIEGQHQCSFKEEKITKKSGPEHVVEGATSVLFKSKTVHKITEYVWNAQMGYEIKLFAGSDPNQQFVILHSHNGINELVTKTKDSPLSASGTTNRIQLDVTDLLHLVRLSGDNNEVESLFTIDREHKDCHTPRRNKDIGKLLDFFERWNSWSREASFLLNNMWNYSFANITQPDANLPQQLSEEIFVPVVPFLNDKEGDVAFTSEMVNQLMGDYYRSVNDALHKAEDVFSNIDLGNEYAQSICTVQELKINTMFYLMNHLYETYLFVIDTVENELRNQIVEAIGKVVSTKDLDEYMEFHNRKLFQDQYAPRPFCYDIRIPGHAPEGSISIETTDNHPIRTMARLRSSDEANIPEMKFSLNASTDVKIEGTHIIHGFISHQFSAALNSATTTSYQLCARARQFSSFVLMAGKVVAADRFEPTCSIIIQNKDELILPLLFNPIPTAKEFRDSIASLSPEQQEFCKQYRKMQLGSTLFAICVIPIKSLMERLLNLPTNALTKEIKLTQQLMRLFIEFQVPSDLMTFEGDKTLPLDEKLKQVRGHVEALFKVIDESKQKQLDERIQMEKFANPMATIQAEAAPPGAPSPKFGMAFTAMKKKSVRGAARRSMGGFGAAASPPPAPMVLQASGLIGSSNNDVQSSISQTQEESQEKQTDEGKMDAEREAGSSENSDADYTILPHQLESRFDRFDENAKLRPTKIELGLIWVRKFYKSLISTQEEKSLNKSDQKTFKNQAMDLMDALSRSGELSLTGAMLHVMVAVTHCFDKTVMDTLVMDNTNPIEPIERSTMLLASSIHKKPIETVLDENAVKRVEAQVSTSFIKDL